MEFLLVVFDADRDVLIDGVAAGVTNHLITLAPGTYIVSLDGPGDFDPIAQVVVVEDSSPLRPTKVVFV